MGRGTDWLCHRLQPLTFTVLNRTCWGLHSYFFIDDVLLGCDALYSYRYMTNVAEEHTVSICGAPQPTTLLLALHLLLFSARKLGVSNLWISITLQVRSCTDNPWNSGLGKCLLVCHELCVSYNLFVNFQTWRSRISHQLTPLNVFMIRLLSMFGC